MINDKIMKTAEDIISLDVLKNVLSIGLQSNTLGGVEINIICKDYNAITDDLWNYIFENSNEHFQIDFFGIDQELPPIKETIYRRK